MKHIIRSIKKSYSLNQVSHMGRSALWHSTTDEKGAEAMHG